MAKIELINVTKRFGNLTALNNISLEIRDKEFFVLFGPAGAGKTTILNNIAGIQIPDAGIVKINDEIVNQVDPAHRNVAMVFENYALYPNKTVYDNMASPLRSPMYKKDEAYIKEAVMKAATLMKIDMLLDRLPSQLSNGQRQRVALGRALVRDPNVFLFDEPLAHLDAKLRNLMRGELKEMQHNFETTSIYVTHDFMEAMSLADRIAIIDHGTIIQVGISDEIYYMPRNEFVAQLMGDPEINLLACTLLDDQSTCTCSWDDVPGYKFEVPDNPELINRLKALEGKEVNIGIRPQNVQYSFTPVAGAAEGTLYSFDTIGNKSVLITQVGDAQVRAIAPNGLSVQLDQPVYLTFDLERAIFFDAESSEYIGRYDEADVLKLVDQQKQETTEESGDSHG